MSDIGTDTKAKLAENAAKRRAEAQVVEQPQTLVEQTIQQIEVAPKATSEVNKPDPDSEAVPGTEVKVKSPTDPDPSDASNNPTTDSTLVAQTEEELQWDAGLVNEPAASTSGFDFKKFGSALGLEVTSEAELVQTASERLAKLKTLEIESAKTFENVPAELREAIEVAKKGGDWATFVGSSLVNIAALDPVDLFEEEFERTQLHKFKLPNGAIDEEKYEEALNSIHPSLKQMQGEQIKQRLAYNQAQRKAQVQAQVQQQTEQFQKNLSEASRTLTTQFPRETFGITVEPKHVSNLYEGVTSLKLIKKHLGDIPAELLTKFDASKLLATLAKAEWTESIAKHNRSQGISEGKKSILNRVQNPQINSTGISAAPEATEAEKPKTSTQKIAAYVERISGGPRSL